MLYKLLMSNSSKAPASIIAAAVVAILCAGFFLLGCTVTFFAFLLVKLPPTSTQPPPFFKTLELAMMAFGICLSVFGIITGVALIYHRNWARISILIWGGVFTFFAAVGIPFAFLLPKFTPPNSPQLPEGSGQMVQWILVLIYGLPLAIGVWWLILFNRKSIKAQFAPTGASAEASLPQKPRCPLPIVVLAWFYIASALNVAFIPFVPMRIPFFLFGLTLPGKASLIFLILTFLAFFVAGVGVLRLKPWSYSLLMGLQMFWLANGIVSMFSPRYGMALVSYMKDFQAWMHLPEAEFSPEYFAKQFHWTMIFGLVLSGVIVGLLVYYRPRFLEAASQALKPSSQNVTL